MPVIDLLVILAVIGFLLWLVNTYIPMNATIKKVITWIVIAATVLWLLQVFGIWTGLSSVRIGPLHH